MDLHFYSAFPVYWPLKALYSTCHIHPFKHTFTYTEGRGCHARCQLLIRSNLGFRIFLKDISAWSWGSRRFKPATFQLLDNSLYLLRYSRSGKWKQKLLSTHNKHKTIHSDKTLQNNCYSPFKNFSYTCHKISYFALSLLITFPFKSISILL